AAEHVRFGRARGDRRPGRGPFARRGRLPAEAVCRGRAPRADLLARPPPALGRLRGAIVADAAGARGPAPARRGEAHRRHRERPRDQPEDGADARRPHLREVRRAQPDAGARLGLPSGSARASLESFAVTLALVTAGESHGPALVAILTGLPAGLILDKDAIDADLRRRQQGYGRSPRQQIETDEVEVLAGLRHGRTLGTPLALVVRNRDHKNWTWGMSPWPPEGEPQGKGTKPVTLPRPGHADLAGVEKYGLADVRDALERASARHTAVAVAAGAVANELLRTIEIEVASTVVTRDLEKRIDEARAERDTVGGVVQVTAQGVPPGLGSYATKDDRLDARLAAALMGIQAVKGVEIGEGFALAELRGSQAHDEIEPGRRRPTNRAGGR